jgi:hypothetical protein
MPPRMRSHPADGTRPAPAALPAGRRRPAPAPRRLLAPALLPLLAAGMAGIAGMASMAGMAGIAGTGPAEVAAVAAGAGTAVLTAATPAAAASSPYSDGDRVQFTGIVTDAAGKPMPGVQVALEAARSYLRLRELRHAEKDARRVLATTNAQGEYGIEWTWDDYFNRFQLLAGITVRRGRTESLQVVEREDVSERVLAGSPVVSAIVIHDRGLVDRLQAFVATVRSADEHRVYEEMGIPDDVKRVNFTGRAPSAEVSWWYFDAGKAYRFRDGRLEQVERFDPVRGF